VRALRIGLAVAAVPFGLYGYHLLVHDLDGSVGNAIASIGVAWIFIAAGLVAWGLRPRSGVGPLMIFVGYALLFRKLQYSHDPRVFTAGFALGEIGLTAAYAHVALSYPSGTLRSRLDRWAVVGGYAAVIAFPVAMLLVLDHMQTCIFDNCPPPQARSVIAIAPSSRAFDAIEDVYKVLVYGALTVLFVTLIGRRLWRATPRGRRLLAPLVVAALFMATRGVFGAVVQIVGTSGRASELIYSWQIAGQIALPLALLAGLLTARLAKGTVADIVLELRQTPPTGVRDVLARALGDPTLEVAFWLPERRAYVDIDGAAVVLPTDHRDQPPGTPRYGRDFRAVTYLTHDEEPVAALVHDPSLRDEPGLLDAAGEAAVLALENARLQADVRAQLAKVQESRRRIVTAGDERARKIERDIHDGAQQRLVALALELRIAQRELRSKLDPEVTLLLNDAVGKLQLAVDELRELARGVHPAVLTEDGLPGAIDSLAARTSIPMAVSAVPEERLPPEIEAAAYFVVCEAVANAVKHAHASRLDVSAERLDGRLVVAIRDDGVGGADENAGTGLRGLVDRVEAHGGTLRIESPAGEGTRVIGELPCAS
jgi:signal transduction histidine kinase